MTCGEENVQKFAECNVRVARGAPTRSELGRRGGPRAGALLCEARDLGVDRAELPRPLGVVEELAQVVAVVVGRVALRVVRGRQRRHLVPIDAARGECEQTQTESRRVSGARTSSRRRSASPCPRSSAAAGAATRAAACRTWR